MSLFMLPVNHEKSEESELGECCIGQRSRWFECSVFPSCEKEHFCLVADRRHIAENGPPSPALPMADAESRAINSHWSGT